MSVATMASDVNPWNVDVHKGIGEDNLDGEARVQKNVSFADIIDDPWLILFWPSACKQAGPCNSLFWVLKKFKDYNYH